MKEKCFYILNRKQFSFVQRFITYLLFGKVPLAPFSLASTMREEEREFSKAPFTLMRFHLVPYIDTPRFYQKRICPHYRIRTGVSPVHPTAFSFGPISTRHVFTKNASVHTHWRFPRPPYCVFIWSHIDTPRFYQKRICPHSFSHWRFPRPPYCVFV